MVPLYSSPPFGGFTAPRAASPVLTCSDSGAIGKPYNFTILFARRQYTKSRLEHGASGCRIAVKSRETNRDTISGSLRPPHLSCQ